MNVENPSPAYMQRIEELAKELTQVTENLGDTNLGVARTIPEYIFRKVYLPILHGDLVTNHGATLQHWISYAGSPYSPVNVVSNNNPNEVLFTVPPCYDRNSIHATNGSQGEPIAHIIKTAEQYGRIQPVTGLRYLQDKLEDKALVMSDSASVITNLNAWDAIFVRYGHPSMFDGIDVKNNPDDSSNENNNAGNGAFLYPDD